MYLPSSLCPNYIVSETSPGTDPKNAFKDLLKGGKETLNEQIDKAKAWASENPNLAIGGGAIAGLTAFWATFGVILPAIRARASRRAERNKHRNRHERRDLEEDLHPQLSDEELLDVYYELLQDFEGLE